MRALFFASLVLFLALFAPARPTRADSFLTDETFFQVSESELATLDKLDWRRPEAVARALRPDRSLLWHMRLITRDQSCALIGATYGRPELCGHRAGRKYRMILVFVR